jgi:hypothetical protein
MNLIKLIAELPKEIQTHIYEYNHDHRKKMYWVLDEIRNMQYCDVCNKIIMIYVYSMPRSDMICCSTECVDNYY